MLFSTSDLRYFIDERAKALAAACRAAERELAATEVRVRFHRRNLLAAALLAAAAAASASAARGGWCAAFVVAAFISGFGALISLAGWAESTSDRAKATENLGSARSREDDTRQRLSEGRWGSDDDLEALLSASPDMRTKIERHARQSMRDAFGPWPPQAD
jgi:hypothetical protein